MMEDPNSNYFDLEASVEHHFERRYRLGQVEWALWGFFTFAVNPQLAMPQVFSTRIKRLLEIDRATPLEVPEGEDGIPQPGHAFINGRPEGRGTDMAYSAFNAFCLAVGLDLLDTGCKQSEVVHLLRYIRPALEDEYAGIMRSPPSISRQWIQAKDRPLSPAMPDGRMADCRVFAIIKKVEIKEIFPRLKEHGISEQEPLFLEPVFCRGIGELQDELNKTNFNYRKGLVIELAHAAAYVAQYLTEAPVIKRGRQ